MDLRVFLYVFFLGPLDVHGHRAEDWLIFADLVLDCDLMVRCVDSFR